MFIVILMSAPRHPPPQRPGNSGRCLLWPGCLHRLESPNKALMDASRVVGYSEGYSIHAFHGLSDLSDRGIQADAYCGRVASTGWNLQIRRSWMPPEWWDTPKVIPFTPSTGYQGISEAKPLAS